ISSDTWGAGKGGNVDINADNILVDGQGKSAFISSYSHNEVLNAGNAGNVSIKANNLSVLNGGQVSSDTSGTGHGGGVDINADNILVDGQGKSTAISSNSINQWIPNAGNAGTVSIKANNLRVLNSGQISSSTKGTGDAGKVTVTAPIITLDNASISAEATAQSQGQTGNVIVTADKAIYLANNAKISMKNDATIANPSAIIPTSVTVSAPDIDLKNSSITTEATGNVDAGNININFSHWLTMDPSFISTSANTGNGGDITIQGGELIYLKDSGFLTSVSGTNSNGGNINATANYLVMDTGVIQANAVGGSGGNINLNLKALIPSQNKLTLGGRKATWQPFKTGLNVIQAASDNGVSGSINVTSPQFDISASISGLDSELLVMPMIDSSLCRSSAMLDSSLSRVGEGGIPTDESQYGFIPPVTSKNLLKTPELNSSAENSITPIFLANLSAKRGGAFPCASL
ncbi:MAG: hypothetical protein RLZ75_240, partial [Pseudomonadota bacterium]